MNPDDPKKGLLQNWMSVTGSILAIVNFSSILVVITLDFLAKQRNPYLGAIAYLVLPVFLIIGLLCIPVGAWRERRRRQRQAGTKRFPLIDFNNPLHQKWAYVTVGIVTVFALFSAFGSFRAYEFTESVTFCGAMCHQVMEPEFTAYKHSPHARVDCVQCHIGPGADWFVRSKLSGAYQIYSVLFNKYHRPIETPIGNLRPAQETCEQCHWPQQFFGAVENDHRYFLADESNTPWQTRMLVLVGGGERTVAERQGIHWHMNIANEVHYIAADKKRQTIPWVKVRHQDGDETIYVDTDSSYSTEHPPQGELRRMDCIDCHNRPSHNFWSPQRAVNDALARGDISSELPYIKREALKVLSARYNTKAEGITAIAERLRTFYKERYPDIATTHSAKLDKAIHAITEMYERNFFPSMGVSWEVYPENIGHMTAPGCFRCHDGKHHSPEGKVISNDCNSCHVIIAQGPPGAMETSVEGLEFRHPEDIEGMWKEMACFECHTGGAD